jgi:hypothetical protein
VQYTMVKREFHGTHTPCATSVCVCLMTDSLHGCGLRYWIKGRAWMDRVRRWVWAVGTGEPGRHSRVVFFGEKCGAIKMECQMEIFSGHIHTPPPRPITLQGAVHARMR